MNAILGNLTEVIQTRLPNLLMAIAFGIGGRDIATETINRWAKKVEEE